MDYGLTKQERWNQKNRDKTRAACRRWYARNTERERIRHRVYKEQHRSEYTQRQLARQRKAPLLTQEELAAVYDYYGTDCVYCGGPATGVDHLQPVARGGTNDFFNLAPCCKECNLKKQARPIWVMLGAA